MKYVRSYKSKFSLIFLAVFLCSFAGYTFINLSPEPTGTEKAKHIKIALLLDTSSSMDGLIEQAKSQLWEIVNTMSKAKKNGEFAKLDIALYQYGNSRLASQHGFIQQILPLTNDLDALSDKLFNLKTSGGEEFCGRVINRAVKELTWTNDPNSLNLIFIAGNENFNQGNVDYSIVCKTAAEKNIIVNTIFCGEKTKGVSGYWEDGALLAGGHYANLEMNKKTQYISTPYDQNIADLNDKLNATYIPYGRQGKAKQANQLKQDYNSSEYGLANSVNRTISKNSHLYFNGSWDLVDANSSKTIDVTKMNDSDLPENMQSMDDSERLAYIEVKTKERRQINAQIARLSNKRDAYLERQQTLNNGLNNALTKVLKTQARQRGFSFDGDDILSDHAAIEEATRTAAFVDFDVFDQVTAEAKAHRKDRLIWFEEFVKASKESNTIILDTRSKAMYDRMHIKGAVHLNFSDFNIQSLARVIPSYDTKILIYCNNNFKQEPLFVQPFVTKSMPVRPIGRSPLQGPPQTLALNIPTYINLYGYGYKNVYELAELVSTDHLLLELEGY